MSRSSRAQAAAGWIFIAIVAGWSAMCFIAGCSFKAIVP